MAKDKPYNPATVVRENPAKKTTTTTTTTVSKTVPTRPSAVESAPAPAPVTRSAPEAPRPSVLPFGRRNYTLMLAGIGIILLGFFIMSLDKEAFGFGFLGLTLGPLVVMSGFILEFFAILVRPTKTPS